MTWKYEMQKTEFFLLLLHYKSLQYITIIYNHESQYSIILFACFDVFQTLAGSWVERSMEMLCLLLQCSRSGKLRFATAVVGFFQGVGRAWFVPSTSTCTRHAAPAVARLVVSQWLFHGSGDWRIYSEASFRHSKKQIVPYTQFIPKTWWKHQHEGIQCWFVYLQTCQSLSNH